MNRILLVEDEVMLAEIVKDSLASRGFEITTSHDGKSAWTILEAQQFDCIVLDVMMPELDGFSLIQKIRTKDAITPVIFLTARSQTQDVVKGFELGANDYLRKPFSIDELIVRIKALTQRQILATTPTDIITLGKYNFNPTKQTLQFENQIITLSHKETALLEKLVLQANQVVERSPLLLELWGDDSFFNARSMDVFISKLRRHLSKDANLQIINIRGIGYKLVV